MNQNRTEIIFNWFNEHQRAAQLYQLWNALVSKIEWGTEDKHKALTILFTDLVLDNRFCLLEDGSWNIRTNLKPEDKPAKTMMVNQFSDLTKFKDFPAKSSKVEEENHQK